MDTVSLIVLISLVTELGGITLLRKDLETIIGEKTAASIMCLLTGLMLAAYSSSSEVTAKDRNRTFLQLFALSLYTCTPGGANRVTVRCNAVEQICDMIKKAEMIRHDSKEQPCRWRLLLFIYLLS